MSDSNKEPYYEKIKDFYLVWHWKKRYNRYVCTNRFEDEENAKLAITKKRRKRGSVKKKGPALG